jgi:putative tricarboxylic transport membrane protein
MSELSTLQQLIYGFNIALDPANIFYCFLGVLLGTLVGVLPGVGPPAGLCILLPITYNVPAASSLIMLSGIYYGAMYGGSTTSILLNVPGEAASVITCLDGHVMARKGRAGPALGIAAFGSFIGGTIALICMVIVGPPLARWTLKFGAVEMTSLLVVAFVLCVYLSSKSIPKAIIMIFTGLFLSTIGMDYISGQRRFNYHLTVLMDGVGFIPVIMGLFGVAEVLINLETTIKNEIFEGKIKNLLPNLQDWKDSIGPIFRGSFLGFFLGLLPGGSSLIGSFASYALEKKLSKKKFGTGVIEGVAGPETSNNSASTGAFVPLLCMGIPGNVTTAILLGALMIHGVQPGPLLIKNHPDIFWGIIASMYIGNVFLVILNLPLIPLWVKILRVPYYVLYPIIVVFCVIGSYSENNSIFDIVVMVIFGVIGYVLRKFEYEPAPLVMAFVLGGMFENSFRQSLIMSRGSFYVFFSHPISAVMLIIASLLLISPLFFKRALPEE